ncbi:hypothetical protein Clacol_002213 [Clathrus columnatus]|uniref:F-box associated domain-containing protein n=1 Tax=Clathrus columnatus TaxID=1419009 RepID=A0AAV5A4Q5_9AGAM|nr:hypothetical protein Clacol_002213 [Clathrus columnatus]
MTFLSISEDGERRIGEFSSIIRVRGSADSAAWRQESPGSRNSAFEDSYDHHDLWGSFIPVQFSIMDGKTNPDSENRVRHPAALRVLFSVITDYSTLFNLNTITLRTDAVSVSGDALGKELMNFLRRWRKKGNRSLKTIEVERYASLPKNTVSEAATLGVRVLEFSPRK